ncbi:hypothetical protein LTSEHVI_1365, partial [Salmonella enterica subsp. enterica serovar Hvittingfoss str. A4-620]
MGVNKFGDAIGSVIADHNVSARFGVAHRNAGA